MRAKSPYSTLPNTSFWKRSVAALAPQDVDPVIETQFTITSDDAVATAGSCFAQHISRTLSERGFNYLVPEKGPIERNYGVYPCRFGNIYTIRQLLQTFERAYGLRDTNPNAWTKGAHFVDPYRPQIEPNGYATIEDLEFDRETHYTKVREMFETCDIFIFTLGLTEGWETSKGVAVPLAPGVAGDPLDNEPDTKYHFKNFSVNEMVDDFSQFITRFRKVNPNVKVLLTVSPVPLIATYEKRHVLESNVYSKSALRVAADMIVKENKDVFYFPSFEIITGPHNGYRYFEDDLRSVSPEGVANVMTVFSRHFLTENKRYDHRNQIESRQEKAKHDNMSRHELYEIICDEENIDP